MGKQGYQDPKFQLLLLNDSINLKKRHIRGNDSTAGTIDSRSVGPISYLIVADCVNRVTAAGRYYLIEN